jgi:hypothetical protein
MLQLPALWPYLGPLQAAFSLHVAREWSPPPRMFGEGEHPEYLKLLQTLLLVREGAPENKTLTVNE